MPSHAKKNKLDLAMIFAGASALATWRKSRGKRGGGARGNNFKGRFQFTDIDEDKIARLARRKQMVSKDAAITQTPVAVWMRVVTDYGRTFMMNADQFEAGGARNVASATPHFS